MGYLVGGPGEILQRIDDAVEYHHVEDECGGVYHVDAIQYEPAAEPQYHHYYHGSQKFGHGVRRILAYGHAVHVVAVLLIGLPETVRHLLLCNESLDDAQASEGLVQLGDNVAPTTLHLGRLALEFAAYLAHHPPGKRCDEQHEESKFPTDGNKGDEAHDDGYGLAYHHVHGRHHGTLHALGICTHAGNDVALVLLGEETQGQAQHLVIQLRADVLHHTGAQGHHHCAGGKVAQGLYAGHHHQRRAHDDQRNEGSVLGNEVLHVGIAIVHHHLLIQCAPCPLLVLIFRTVYLEQNVQYGDEHHKGKDIHPLREEVQHDGARQVLAIGPEVTPHYL